MATPAAVPAGAVGMAPGTTNPQMAQTAMGTTMGTMDPQAQLQQQQQQEQEQLRIAMFGTGLGSWLPGQCPPDFLEMHYAGNSSLGLVIDWSMALPVVSALIPGSAAADWPGLRPGFVVVMANQDQIMPGATREKVEQMLAVRPLKVIFEKIPEVMWNEDIAFSSVKKAREALTAALTAKEREAVKVILGPMGQTFFDPPPGRSQMSTYGGSGLGHSSSGKLPQLTNGSGSMSQGSLEWTKRSSSLRGGPSKNSFSMTTSSFGSDASLGNSRMIKRRTSMSMQRVGDPCYHHIVEANQDHGKQCGPGHPARWPLCHNAKYDCHMLDMILVNKINNAYEVGFRAYKRDKPNALHINSPELVTTPRVKRVMNLKEITCDTCGKFICDKDTKNPAYFWFCRKCKKNGHRYELCTSCHAVEIQQGEGKHVGKVPHPHFTRCEHSSLVRYKDLRSAYPGNPHLRRALCDVCGLLIMGEGDGRGAKSLRDTQPNASGDAPARKPEVYICLTCFGDHGIRFELCGACAFELRDRGNGIRHLLGL